MLMYRPTKVSKSLTLVWEKHRTKFLQDGPQSLDGARGEAMIVVLFDPIVVLSSEDVSSIASRKHHTITKNQLSSLESDQQPHDCRHNKEKWEYHNRF